jgi:hypothetical protein
VTAVKVDVERLVLDWWYEPWRFPRSHAPGDRSNEDYVLVSLREARTVADWETIELRDDDGFLIVHFLELEDYLIREEGET